MKEEASALRQLPVDQILELQREDLIKQHEQEQLRQKVLRDRGFQPESLFDDGNT